MKGVNQVDKQFSVSYSQMAKGVAVLLLFLHHVLNGAYSYISIVPVNIMVHLVSLGKVCVGIFFIISGYGMYSSYWRGGQENHKIIDDIRFAGEHVVKLLFSFWVIYILFVPLSVLFNYNFVDVYTSRGNAIVNMITDAFGMASIFSTPSMNNTWWYLGASIIFYLISPICFKIIKRFSKGVYVFSVILVITSMYYYGMRGLVVYFVPYYLGAFIAEKDLFRRAICFGKRWEIWKQLVLVFLFGSIVYIREFRLYDDPKFYKLDWILAGIIIYFLFYYMSADSYIGKRLILLGKQSGNIFFFHSFFYAVWFKELVYGKLRLAILVYITFLLGCYLVSLAIEKIKEIIGINWFIKKILHSQRNTIAIFLCLMIVLAASRVPFIVGSLAIGEASLETEEAPIVAGSSRRIIPEYDIIFEEFVTPKWKSSNPDIVKVSYDGVITAVQEGEAEVYLEIGRKKLRYMVEVVE